MIYSTFEAMYSSRFCGLKVADLYGNHTTSCCQHQCVFVSGLDLGAKQNYVETLVRRLFHARMGPTAGAVSENMTIMFVVETSESVLLKTSLGQASAKADINYWIQNLKNEYPKVAEVICYDSLLLIVNCCCCSLCAWSL